MLHDMIGQVLSGSSYPVNIIFFSIILSGSMLLKEPTAATVGAATVGAATPPKCFRAIKGRGGKQIGA